MVPALPCVGRAEDKGIGNGLYVPAAESIYAGAGGVSGKIAAQGQFFAVAGDAKISAVDVRDIAAVAAAALTGEGHVGRTYDITGPEALTHGEMAEKLSRALNREIQYGDVTPEAMMEALLNIGLPHWQVDGLIEDYAHYRRGEASAIASGVQDAIGTPPRPFDDFARDYALLEAKDRMEAIERY